MCIVVINLKMHYFLFLWAYFMMHSSEFITIDFTILIGKSSKKSYELVNRITFILLFD